MSEKPKALIVDDESDMLDFLERALRRRFQIRRVSSGADALELLQAEEFELLVTDQKMPKMAGLELLERIADSHPTLVKVLISGFAELPDIKRAQSNSQIHNYIFKPIDSRKLLDAIDTAYEAARSRAAK